jgi:hypothetical protein
LLQPFGPEQAPGAAHPLAAIILIDLEPFVDQGIRLEPWVGASAVMALIERSLALFDAAHATLPTQLQAAASVTARGVPVLGLSFPRRFQALDRVHDALISTLGGRLGPLSTR